MTRLLTAAAIGLALWHGNSLTFNDPGYNPEPLDVPAIQEEVPYENRGVCFVNFEGCTVTDMKGNPVDVDVNWLRDNTLKSVRLHRWACTDGDRILEESFNHKRHTCRRIQP